MKILLRATLALLLTTATARAVPLTIRVVDAQNQPIAGATARVVDYADWSESANKLPVATETKATADGTIALDLRGAGDDPDLLSASEGGVAGVGGARVRAPGFGAVNAILFAGENVVTLGPAARVEGVARDEAGVPIAGAKVRLWDIEENKGGFADLNASSGLAPEIAIADAQGRWTMDGLARGYASFIGSAPNAVATALDVFVDAEKVAAPPLVLPPAGTIKGRILDAQGRPMKDVHVYWDGGYGSRGDQFYSDADGQFVLDDVPLGENYVSFSLLNSTWMGVDEDPRVELEKRGEVVDIGDVRMGIGILISGLVRDKNSGLPLPNVELRSQYSVLKTGADGRFRGYVSRPFISLDVLGEYSKNRAVSDVPFKAKEFDAGEILVERKAKVTLDLRDEAGNAVPRATLRFRAVENPDFVLQNNTVFGTESANIGPIAAGEYTIEGAELWQVVAPKTPIRVDLDAPAAPVKVTLRPIRPMSVSGRVVDETGRGVAGAEIYFVLGSYRLAYSDREGNWRVELPPSDDDKAALRRVTGQGMTRLRGGEMTRDAATGDWSSTDIVMSRLDATLRGRVTDENGQGVAGASVSWGDNSDFARTGADGGFELKGLPAEPFTVRASDGPRYASVVAAPDAPLQIQLAPAPAPITNEALERLWRATSIGDFSRLERYADILGPARLFEAARRKDAGGDPTRGGAGLDEYLKMRARHARTDDERESVTREGVALLIGFDPAQLDGMGAGAIAQLAATGDEDSREWAARWFDAQDARLRTVGADGTVKLNAKDQDGYAIARVLRVAGVGAALGRPRAADYRAWAMRAMAPFGGDFRQSFRGMWNHIIWESGSQVFEDALQAWEPRDQMSALAVALEYDSDAPRARALLDRLEKLNDDPRVIAAEAAEKAERPSYRTSRAAAIEEGRINYVRTVAPLDATEALRVLEAASEGDLASREAALVVARAALAQRKIEVARRAVLLGLKDHYSNVGGASALALMARSFAPDAAKQLLERASTVAKEEENQSERWSRPIENYAFALRPFDAGRGRLLLEQQWAREQARPRVAGDDWQRADAQQKLAWALSVYDLPRALQWLDGIKDERGGNSHLADTRVDIIAAALATDAQRPFALSAR